MQVHSSTAPTSCSATTSRCPSHLDPTGMEVAATRGVVGSVLMMLEGGATHIGVATDHVVESFRNDLYAGYKTSDGHGPGAARAVPGARGRARARSASTVWAMVEVEADDALASAARGRRGRRRGSSRRSSARPTRTSASASVGDRSCSSTGARARSATPSGVRREVRRAAGVDPRLPRARRRHRRRLPRASRAGARSRPRPCSRTTSTSRRSPTLAKDWDVEVRGAVKLATDARTRGRDGRRPVQGARDAADDADVGDRRRLALDRTRAPTSTAWCERLGAPGMLRAGRASGGASALTARIEP